MDSYIVPTLIIFIANVFSDKHGSFRYEFISAIFGWVGGGCLLLALLLQIMQVITIFMSVKFPWISVVVKHLYEIAWFALLTVISRDYEKILKPIIDKKWK